MKTIFQKILDWHNDPLIHPPKVKSIEYQDFFTGQYSNIMQFYQAMYQKYGSTYFANRSYVTSSPNLAAYILKENSNNYIRKGFIWNQLESFLGKNSITYNGEKWVQRRKISAKAYKLQNIKIYAEQLSREILPLSLDCFNFSANIGETVNLTYEIFKITYGATVNFLLNYKDLDVIAKQAYSFFLKLNEYSWAFGKYNPSIKNILFTINKIKFLKNIKLMHEKSCNIAKNYTDLNDYLVDGGISKKDIIEELRGHILAGMTTTTSAILWALYHIYKNQRILKKLRSEILTVVDGKLIEFDDLEKLSYCKMVVNEALRMYPSIGLLPKYLVKDDFFGKYKFKKNNQIVIDLYSLHRNPDYWGNPEEFYPERFEEPLKHKCCFIPFATGGHTCIGNRIALTQMMITISNIVRKFDLDIMDKNVFPKMWAIMMPSIQINSRVKLV